MNLQEVLRDLWNLVLSRYGSIRVDSVFQAVQLPGQRKQNYKKKNFKRVAHPPAGVAHLDACLADVDGDHLSHGDRLSLLLSNEHKSQVVLIQWKSP